MNKRLCALCLLLVALVCTRIFWAYPTHVPLLEEALDGSKTHWVTASAIELGFEQRSLQKAISAADDLNQFYCLLVIKDGKIVVERYFDGANAGKTYQLRSITKNVTSALTGITIEEGKLAGIDVSIETYFPDLATEKKSEISVKHLLNMSSGIDWDERKEILSLVNNEIKEPIRYVLSKEMKYQPGEKMKYNSITTHVLSRVLEIETGMPLHELAKTKLFEPLGIEKYEWEKDPEGYAWGGYGLQLTGRDLAKLGQLYLQKGNWKGEQLVPESWVIESSQKQIETGVEGLGYSNQWWHVDIEVYDQPIYYGQGYGGQALVIVPDKNMVIVALQNHFVLPARADEQWNDLVEQIIRPIEASVSK